MIRGLELSCSSLVAKQIELRFDDLLPYINTVVAT